MPDVTRLLNAVAIGDRQAAVDLLPVVYDELRKLAAARMAAEPPGHTLDATALICGHFFAAAQAMRRILVNHSRDCDRVKRGGDWKRVEVPDLPEPTADERLLALDD